MDQSGGDSRLGSNSLNSYDSSVKEDEQTLTLSIRGMTCASWYDCVIVVMA